MTFKKEELIRKYATAIREGNAAVFAGAGLSRSSGFVDWKGLLRPLAKEIALDVDKETDLLSVAQYYRNRKRNAAISQAIMSAFSKDVEPSENIRILARLPIFTYWTTNYDELLEKGIREANRNPDVKSESDQLSVMKPDRDAIVYKMHGDVNRPANAVLTKSDYELYEHTHPLFRTALKGDLVSKVFLFVGFSFEDPNLAYILGQIHTLLGENVPEHYCFFRRIQQSDYDDDAAYRYDLAKQEMQEEDLRNYGIQTVFVDSYDEITEILREIEKASRMKNVFVSGSAEKFDAPWNRKSAEDFASKLAAELVRKDYRITSGFGLGIGSSIINGALEVIYSEKFRHTDEHLCLRPFPQNISDPIEKEKQRKLYREDMLKETGVAIFIFGNKKNEKGDIVEADGCISEFKIAKEANNMIIPIGSTGYAARTIWNEITSNLTNYPYLSDYIDELGKETDTARLIELVMRILRSE